MPDGDNDDFSAKAILQGIDELQQQALGNVVDEHRFDHLTEDEARATLEHFSKLSGVSHEGSISGTERRS